MIAVAPADPILFDADTARTVLNLLADARNDDGELRGLTQREIDLKRKAKAALAYWASQDNSKGRAA